MTSAQEPAHSSAPAAKASHPFFDSTNLVLTGVESGALLADGITTQFALRKYPESFREADPLARPFVLAGWPGQIAGGTLVVAAEVGLRFALHRKNHHRLERWLPMILTAYGTICAAHNARELSRAGARR